MKCQHTDCDGEIERVDDRFLPNYIKRHECRECGEWYIEDIETGEMVIDA